MTGGDGGDGKERAVQESPVRAWIEAAFAARGGCRPRLRGRGLKRSTGLAGAVGMSRPVSRGVD